MKRSGPLGVSPLAPVGMAIFIFLFVIWMGLFVFHGRPGQEPNTSMSHEPDGTAVQGDAINSAPGSAPGAKPSGFSNTRDTEQMPNQNMPATKNDTKEPSVDH